MMPELTDEQRREAGERLRLGRERAAAERAVGAPSPEEMMVAAAAGNIEMTNEDIFAMQLRNGASLATRAPEYQGATVTHSTAGLRRAYKPTGHGYQPRNVPATNLAMLVKAGWLAACPDCGRADCGVDGDQNGCTGRAKRAFRRCPLPVCRKRFWDPLETTGATRGAEKADPAEIVDDAYAQSTPETRTLAVWRAHMLAFHPQESPAYGIFPQMGIMTGLNPQVGTEAGVR
jgi:hypothetical protein